MIASIDEYRDIKIFLDPVDLEVLQRKRIEGVLVKMLEPEKQGIIGLSFNQERVKRTGQNVEVDTSGFFVAESNFCIDVFIGEFRYQEILTTGKSETRYFTSSGSKIEIYDRTRLEDFNLNMYAEDIEFYIKEKQD